jgi:hypothetical protein
MLSSTLNMLFFLDLEVPVLAANLRELLLPEQLSSFPPGPVPPSVVRKILGFFFLLNPVWLGAPIPMSIALPLAFRITFGLSPRIGSTAWLIYGLTCSWESFLVETLCLEPLGDHEHLCIPIGKIVVVPGDCSVF